MINIYNHHNEFLLPLAAEKRHVESQYNNYYMKKWNCNFGIPFSSFHTYIRKIRKMNQFTTPLVEHYRNFNSSSDNLLPAFINWDTIKNDYKKINPKEINGNVIEPEKFGDNWSDNLDKNDENTLKDYFLKFDHLKKFAFINF